MALQVSCDGLVFRTSDPKDNVLTITWTSKSGESNASIAAAAARPQALVVFKLKCTAPQLFHVLPTYGVLVPSMESATTVDITIGLRAFYSHANEEIQKSLPATPRRHSDRFGVEYTVISDEPAMYQKVVGSLGDEHARTEVAKTLWARLNSLTKEHVVMPHAAVYFKTVIDDSTNRRSDSSTPAEGSAALFAHPARVVPLGLHERLASRPPTVMNTPMAKAETPMNVTPTSRGTPTANGSTGDGMRALKEELDSLRRGEFAHSGAPTRGSSNGAGAPRPANGEGGSASSATTSSKSAPIGEVRALFPLVESGSGDSILMTVDSSTAATVKKGKGLKLYLVLVMMFMVYFISMFMRRTSAPSETTGITPSS